MAKARSLEQRLSEVRRLRKEAASPELLKELRKALKDSLNLVVAEAAEITAENHLTELAPELVAAFDRFLDERQRIDKQCRAKIAIAEALNQLDFADEEFFWRGARYVQPEPVWGGEQDTAAPVRVACAFSLVRTRAHGVMPYLVDLLNDPEKPARIGAAQALAYSEAAAAALLLRLKARLGDKDPEVISECFSGLMKLTPSEGVSFVGEFLHSPDLGIRESAVLALGESRRPEAFETLKGFWETQIDNRLKETILMAFALLRLPQATDFLLKLVGEGSESVARIALTALAVYWHDDKLRERVAVEVAKRGGADLQALFEARFRAEK
jgi:HEAT repeat protein